MDIVQFQSFLDTLVSLQAQGLDAQHLIDEAKKAGAEEQAKKDAPAVPVDGQPVPTPVVDVEALKAELASVKEQLAKALADDASDKALITSLQDGYSKIEAIIHPKPVEPTPVVEKPVETPVQG